VKLSGYGIEIDLPAGWDGRIYRRPGGDPTLHAGNFPLPEEDGDFGSGALSTMKMDGVFIVLTEYDRAGAGHGLFARQGLPMPLRAPDLDPNALQRRIPGQFGIQRFFTESERTWCLYVVVGSTPHPKTLLGVANEVLATLSISAHVEPSQTGT
jgi:hypothetical protein